MQLRIKGEGAPTYDFAKFPQKLHGGARPKFYYVDQLLACNMTKLQTVAIRTRFITARNEVGAK